MRRTLALLLLLHCLLSRASPSEYVIGEQSGYNRTATLSFEVLQAVTRGAERGSKGELHEYTHRPDLTRTESLYFMGLFRLYGQIPPANASKALEYFRKAAKQGHQFAQVSVAVLLMSSDGTPRYDTACSRR
jgi:TPR repeat protein